MSGSHRRNKSSFVGGLFRDVTIVTFVALAGIINETFFTEDGKRNPAIIFGLGALLGVPGILRAEEKRKEAKESE